MDKWQFGEVVILFACICVVGVAVRIDSHPFPIICSSTVSCPYRVYSSLRSARRSVTLFDKKLRAKETIVLLKEASTKLSQFVEQGS